MLHKTIIKTEAFFLVHPAAVFLEPGILLSLELLGPVRHLQADNQVEAVFLERQRHILLHQVWGMLDFLAQHSQRLQLIKVVLVKPNLHLPVLDFLVQFNLSLRQQVLYLDQLLNLHLLVDFLEHPQLHPQIHLEYPRRLSLQL